jgi:glycosyltransferase involved in cell wall biosynthesis
MKLLFVVHRYYPYPGGSEYYVRDMAEEAVRRGHNVCVLTHTHQGDQNGVVVTSDYNKALTTPWDLIIVHGGDVISQDVVHINADRLQSPVAYMIIKPSESPTCLNGLKHHPIITYSSSADLEHIKKHGVTAKARRIRHGIVPATTIKKKDVDAPYYVSAGGFAPHKAMLELANWWEQKGECPLKLYGYIDGPTPPESEKVQVFKDRTRDQMLQDVANSWGYIMNSYEEGFGLVLLEAMINKVPVYSRDIAGGHDLPYIQRYKTKEELFNLIGNDIDCAEGPVTFNERLDDAKNYVMSNHTIVQTLNDIEDIVMERMIR